MFQVRAQTRKDRLLYRPSLRSKEAPASRLWHCLAQRFLWASIQQVLERSGWRCASGINRRGAHARPLRYISPVSAHAPPEDAPIPACAGLGQARLHRCAGLRWATSGLVLARLSRAAHAGPRLLRQMRMLRRKDLRVWRPAVRRRTARAGRGRRPAVRCLWASAGDRAQLHPRGREYGSNRHHYWSGTTACMWLQAASAGFRVWQATGAGGQPRYTTCSAPANGLMGQVFRPACLRGSEDPRH